MTDPKPTPAEEPAFIQYLRAAARDRIPVRIDTGLSALALSQLDVWFERVDSLKTASGPSAKAPSGAPCLHKNATRPSEYVEWCPDCGGLKPGPDSEWFTPDPFQLQAHEIACLQSKLKDMMAAKKLAEQRGGEARRTAEQWRQESNDNADAVERVRQEREGIRRERDALSAELASVRGKLDAAEQHVEILREGRKEDCAAVEAATKELLDWEAKFHRATRELAEAREELLARDPVFAQVVLSDMRRQLEAEREQRAKAVAAAKRFLAGEPKEPFKIGDRVETLPGKGPRVTGMVIWCGKGAGACVGVQDDADGAEADFSVDAVRLAWGEPKEPRATDEEQEARLGAALDAANSDHVSDAVREIATRLVKYLRAERRAR